VAKGSEGPHTTAYATWYRLHALDTHSMQEGVFAGARTHLQALRILVLSSRTHFYSTSNAEKLDHFWQLSKHLRGGKRRRAGG
jgi:hypothetical protein